MKVFATTFLVFIEWIPWILLLAYVLGRWRDDYVIKFYSWIKFVEKVKKKELYNIASLKELYGRTRVLVYLVAIEESKYVMKVFEKIIIYSSHFYLKRG